MPRTKSPPKAISPTQAMNGPVSEVLTLSEAATYLRLPEADVLRLVDEQGLPARQVGQEWRFLKNAIQAWLSTPRTKENKEGIWAAAGSWKDDPYAKELLQEIWRERGQPVPED